MSCTVTEEYARRGIDTAIIENSRLHVEILSGKGADITKILDKRTDTNILFESPHEWRAPGDGYVGVPDRTFAFFDYYPGGWQDVLPGAGNPSDVAGAPLGLHGEASLAPWETTQICKANRAGVSFSLSLSRFPFDIEREVTLEADAARLRVEETVTNRGEVDVHYSWLQHIALGPPLIAPEASLEVPCRTVLTDPDMDDPNARLPSGETYEWPVCDAGDGEVDLREFPPREARVHDWVALTDFTDPFYAVRNPAIDLQVRVEFPTDLFEYLWYWQAFGGYEAAPFFGRNYNVGLEPATSIPNAGLDRAIENGTANSLGPGGSVSATISLETAPVADR